MVYGDAPWQFKGRAIYQLQLVKSDEAKKYIPDRFKLVEFFGYTLGGFYLARYTDSPVGPFDELVVMSGLVWNAPASCAWAARVFVNNKEARDHGRFSVGLPSRLANFKEVANTKTSNVQRVNWWHQHLDLAVIRGGGKQNFEFLDAHVQIENKERRGLFGNGRGFKDPVCTFDLPLGNGSNTWPGPRLTLQLPSFSGATKEFPDLLQYTCKLLCNVRPMRCVSIHLKEKFDEYQAQQSTEDLSRLLQGKPLVALGFNDMVMDVDSPLQLSN
eukprot:TRINITY_DN12116_c1_g1_i1.p1 TRINITY_DN12116_c1_g1~~TRINITY_DN12116_c1_g1_i1.p1  ORF type:complete len:272 (+),score=30.22 TRINITY_DN12116_c1_g1_i1:103-918(+)